MASPALVSTNSLCPREASSRTAAGIMPTRYSLFLISFGTPIFMAACPPTVPVNGGGKIHTRRTVPPLRRGGGGDPGFGPGEPEGGDVRHQSSAPSTAR